jgi:hypothetical protein
MVKDGTLVKLPKMDVGQMRRSLIFVELELGGKICYFASYILSLLCQNKSDT